MRKGKKFEMKHIYFNQKYFSTSPSYENNGNMLFIPEPWLYYNNSFIRFLSHSHLSPRINSIFNIPYKNVWMKHILENAFEDKSEICIIINAHFYNLYTGGIYGYAKRFYRVVKSVFVFSDKVEYFISQYKNFPSIKRLKNDFDLVITYNVEDAKKYDITLDRPCFPVYANISDNLNDYSSDVFFVGANKSRLEQLYSIFELCQQNGLKCDFHINDVKPEQQKYKDLIVYNNYMDYSEVLERVKKTKCVLNIIQEGGAGVTLRDYEAFTFNKIALTNNYALRVTGLYSEEQVIWLDDLKDRLDDILLNQKSGITDFKSIFSLKNWCEWLDSLLSNT